EKMTGMKMDRPVFNQLLSECNANDSIVVWRLDRLGRSCSGLTKLFDELISRKINLVSIRDGIDLQTPAGRLIANVLASVSQFETEVRKERVAAGIAAARQNGKKIGGSKIGRVLVSADKLKVIRLMSQSSNPADRSITTIARTVGLTRNTTAKYV